MRFTKHLLFLIVCIPLPSDAVRTNRYFFNAFVDNYLFAQNLRARSATILGDLEVQGKLFTGQGIEGPEGTVTGPLSSLVNSVARFADTSGHVLKDSSVLIDDLGNITLNGITKNGNTVSWPSAAGGPGTFLRNDGAENLSWVIGGGIGNVSTAVPFTINNALIRVDLPNGTQNVKESHITLDDSDNINGVNQLTRQCS